MSSFIHPTYEQILRSLYPIVTATSLLRIRSNIT